MLKLVIPALIAAGLYKFGNNVAEAAGRLNYRLKDVDFKLYLNPFKASYIIPTFTLENPTRTGLFFDRIDLTARRNDTSLGTVVVDKRVMIPANGSADVQVPFKLNAKDIVIQLIKAFKERKGGMLNLTGTITAGIIKVPVEIEQDLNKLSL